MKRIKLKVEIKVDLFPDGMFYFDPHDVSDAIKKSFLLKANQKQERAARALAIANSGCGRWADPKGKK